jgi:hypothetical protein
VGPRLPFITAATSRVPWPWLAAPPVRLCVVRELRLVWPCVAFRIGTPRLGPEALRASRSALDDYGTAVREGIWNGGYRHAIGRCPSGTGLNDRQRPPLAVGTVPVCPPA